MDYDTMQTFAFITMGGFIIYLGGRLIGKIRQYKPLTDDELAKEEHRKASIPSELQSLEIEEPESLEANSKPTRKPSPNQTQQPSNSKKPQKN
ncbi:MAG: hypothetical protein V1799_03235 [bacterium]